MNRALDSSTAPVQTAADLLHQLGDISPKRVRMRPPPGTATEKDLLAAEARDNSLFELVDGVLVEKAMGQFESRIAAVLIYFLERFLSRHDLGIVYAPDATLRLMPGLVRLPDVCFVSWKRLPGRRLPSQPIADLVPDLAVEVLSVGNTKREMQRKLEEYFEAGVRLVWFIDPENRRAEVHTSPRKSKIIPQDGTLDGGRILPGFRLSLRKLFARVTGEPQ